VGPVDRLAALLTDVVEHTGPFAPAVLFGASFVEYVFPPFPGDTIVVLGAWYAVRGAISWPVAFIAVTLGAVAGAWLDWRVGCSIAPALEARAALRGPLDAERLGRFESAYRRWGALLLVANRFLPGIRAFLFVAAGAARIPLGKVLLLGALSAALWNALLLGLGALIARNLAEMSGLLERYTYAAWAAMAAVAAFLAARVLLRRWKGSG
jgi:membrane-associated protein